MTRTPLVTGSLPMKTLSLLTRSTWLRLPPAALLICKTTRQAATPTASSSKRLHFQNTYTVTAAQLKCTYITTISFKVDRKLTKLVIHYHKIRQNETLEPSSGTSDRWSLFPAAFHDNLELRKCRLCSHFYGSCS